MRSLFEATCFLPLFQGTHSFSPSGGAHDNKRIIQRTISSTSCQTPFHPATTFIPSSSLSVASDPTSTSTNLHNANNSFLQPGPNLIPPLTPTQPKLEAEFYSMMREFSRYTPKDIASISDPRYQALYEGVAAGANETLVMNAFSVAYQDLLPIRLAGRMIYRHLRSTMEECIEERDSKEELLVNEHGLDMHTINHGRRAFMAIVKEDASDRSSEGYMTIGNLIDSGIVDTVVELLEFESFDEFAEMMDAEHDEEITFEKFMVGLQNCKGNKETGACEVNCDLSEVLNEIMMRMEPIEAARNEVDFDKRKKKFSDKYDLMVTTFEEWEEYAPSGDGRMLEVLKGSFAGAKNEKIVKALKIVYMDYSALRLGGDLVFKLMGKLMSRRKKNQASS